MVVDSLLIWYSNFDIGIGGGHIFVPTDAKATDGGCGRHTELGIRRVRVEIDGLLIWRPVFVDLGLSTHFKGGVIINLLRLVY
jgi:hypothetical protein